MSFSSEAIGLIEYISSKFGVVIDWGNDNVLPVLQNLAEKYIAWDLTASIAWIVILILIEIALIVIVRFDLKRWKTEGLTVIGILSIIVLIPIVLAFIFRIIKCVTFPELRIFEYIQGIARTMK